MRAHGRWAVRLVQRGELLEERRFVLRRTARSYARWQMLTACGGHHFTTPIPEGMPPIWDVELVDLRGPGT